MLCDAAKTIYAMIDAMVADTGDVACLTVHRVFECGANVQPALQYVAEVRVGELRGWNYPIFTNDGKQRLRATADTEEDALEKLAALCCLVGA